LSFTCWNCLPYGILNVITNSIFLINVNRYYNITPLFYWFWNFWSYNGWFFFLNCFWKTSCLPWITKYDDIHIRKKHVFSNLNFEYSKKKLKFSKIDAYWTSLFCYYDVILANVTFPKYFFYNFSNHFHECNNWLDICWI
jgi:hypothetical protein